jgi:Dolichyl-phosphate-mannose-protein mannosyltransferase
MTNRRISCGLILAYGALFAFALFLFSYHLDNRPLWGDEAETALLAKNILRFGIPKTVDGVNHITVLGNFRDENAAHVWTWAPWLPEYLVAGVYRLFGENTLTSRVGFAAIGWLSVILLGHVSYQIYRDHRIALSSMFLLATSEIFLLHSRQCRYYSVTVFAEVLLVYGAFALLSNRRRAIWLLAFGLILQFYTNFIVAAANLPLLMALGWFSRRQRQPLLKLAIAVGLVLLVALPWLIYARTWQQSRELIHESLMAKAWYYMTEWHFHFIPWVFLLLPLITLFGKRPASQALSKTTARLLEQSLSILIVGYFIILLLPRSELRYLLPLLPVACLLAATWSFRYLRWPVLAMGLIGLQAATNLIAIVTAFGLDREHGLRSPLFEFIGGLKQGYVDRFTDVRDFFATEARPGQTIWVRDPEFPLIFYTGLHIIDARLRTPENLPDWILPQSASGLLDQNILALPDSIKSYYEAVSIRVRDSDRLDNVPEPDCYQYRPTEKTTDFLIYRKSIADK